jgi:alpha-1,2-mannosyltransferase
VSSRFISFLSAVALLGTAAVLALFVLRDHWPPDLGAVYFGASAYAAGEWQSVYAAPSVFFGALIEDPYWLALAQDQGLEGAPLVSFVYPPLIAAAIAPLTKTVSAVQFIEIGLAVELACLCAAVLLARSVAGGRLPAAIWVVASLVIGLPTVALQNALFHAQPQIIVVAIVLLAFVLYRQGMDTTAGLVLALAGTIKLAPLFLGIVFLADRRWRAASATAIGSIALAVAGLAISGRALQIEFVEQLGRASELHLLSPLGYSVAGLLTALWGNLAGTPVELVNEKSFGRIASVPWITALSYVLLLAGSVLILARTRTLPFPDALPLRLLGIWCLLTVLGPLGWAHYALGPVLMLPAVLGFLPRRQALLLLIPAVAGLSMPPILLVIWLAPGISLGSVAAILSLLILPVALMVGRVPNRTGTDST